MDNSLLKKVYTWMYRMYKLSKKEIRSGKDIGFKNKLISWKKGFFSNSFLLYQLDKNNPSEYLSDYDDNIKAISLNDEHYDFLDDKLKFSNLVKQWTETPNDIATISGGKIISINGKHLDLVDVLKQRQSLILKPLDSASGMGVINISFDEDIRFNKEIITEKELYSRVDKLDNYLVSEFIEQAAYSKKIYPKTANTIRILTMVNPQTGIPFIAAAAHRFGTDESFPVDNCNAGGLTSKIDIETGELSKALTTYFKGNDIIRFDIHPDSGEKISSVKIPNWEYIKEAVLYISEKISFLKYIGWDIIPTENGFVVLEGNNGPDIKLHQVHEPLLRNPSVKEFFEYYKVI